MLIRHFAKMFALGLALPLTLQACKHTSGNAVKADASATALEGFNRAVGRSFANNTDDAVSLSTSGNIIWRMNLPSRQTFKFGKTYVLGRTPATKIFVRDYEYTRALASRFTDATYIVQVLDQAKEAAYAFGYGKRLAEAPGATVQHPVDGNRTAVVQLGAEAVGDGADTIATVAVMDNANMDRSSVGKLWDKIMKGLNGGQQDTSYRLSRTKSGMKLQYINGFTKRTVLWGGQVFAPEGAPQMNDAVERKRAGDFRAMLTAMLEAAGPALASPEAAAGRTYLANLSDLTSRMVPQSLVDASTFPALLKASKGANDRSDDSDVAGLDENVDPMYADEETVSETAEAAAPTDAAGSSADQADSAGADEGSTASDRGAADHGSSHAGIR